ncbi:ribosome recycling factor [Candidatus Peregrinibacteria bacterium RIFOXYB2_FULL_32_7]|nr:MAG: ribosome recycling factor [Candidatus Peregrinibacteria bacterium RIFOXYB2_FULL_32_7]
MSTQIYIDQAKQAFEKAVSYLQGELARLQVGRANTALVEGIQVDAYGQKQVLRNLANISVPDSKTLRIEPWDKSVVSSVEKAIRESDLGLNPANQGGVILLSIPPLTEERRKNLVKIVHRLAEEGKISIRQSRQDTHNKIKNENEFTEDEIKGAEKKLQEAVDNFNEKIDETRRKKEEEVMTV